MKYSNSRVLGFCDVWAKCAAIAVWRHMLHLRTCQLLYAASTLGQLGHVPRHMLWYMLDHMLLHIGTSPGHVMLLPCSAVCTLSFLKNSCPAALEAAGSG